MFVEGCCWFAQPLHVQGAADGRSEWASVAPSLATNPLKLPIPSRSPACTTERSGCVVPFSVVGSVASFTPSMPPRQSPCEGGGFASPISLFDVLTPSPVTPTRCVNLEQELHRDATAMACPPGLPMRVPPGLEPPPGAPSHGSLLHGTKACRPCVWFWRPGSCGKGQDCTHCHLCPEGEAQMRRKSRPWVQKNSRSDNMHPTSSDVGSAVEPSYDSGFDIKLEFPTASDASSTTWTGSENDSINLSEEEEHLVKEADNSDLGDPSVLMQTSEVQEADPLLHELGICVPCAWLWKPSGCQRAKCKFCHLCPEGALKDRKKSKYAIRRSSWRGAQQQTTHD
eukprot:CAMPEP_0177210430 /NCGR_PEP_ID=MMETSP0367-20130122/31545_1 /TAXON_ID=447022 ORGANISM="Scrippsiella hangoei-like, Strain SHHI-4" /NCGR_SAMPLE_ID=MMETSP0367 /ASSEMBLY_ACC=CAM_ASM_000362 /LENGTH=339 /DNA_ID=CAMNT_0018659529 /DNA_START=42 /DNA_END=1061 /DNA_ORIENTATION=-